jgi:hypothetical protein
MSRWVWAALGVVGGGFAAAITQDLWRLVADWLAARISG